MYNNLCVFAGLVDVQLDSTFYKFVIQFQKGIETIYIRGCSKITLLTYGRSLEMCDNVLCIGTCRRCVGQN